MLVQMIGSGLVLSAFIMAQFNLIDTGSRIYLWMNFVGSSLLAIDALLLNQWGFLALEGVWAIVSLVSLIKLLKQ